MKKLALFLWFDLTCFALLFVFDHFVLNLPLLHYLALAALLLVHGLLQHVKGANGMARFLLETDAERHAMFMDYVKEHYDVTPKNSGQRS